MRLPSPLSAPDRVLSPARATTLVALLLTTTCSTGTSSSAALDTLIDSVAHATCAWEFRCCTRGEISALATRKYTTEADCVLYAALEARQSLFNEIAGAHDGHLRIDARAAAACVDWIGGHACNAADGQVTSGPAMMSTKLCQAAFVGLVPAGGRCYSASDCTAGTHCYAASNVGSATDVTGKLGATSAGGGGACIAFQAKGAPCTTNDDCDAAQHLYCRSSDFRCGTPAREGQACSGEQAGFTPPGAIAPTTTASCDPEASLYCDASVKQCRHLPRNGDTCLSPAMGAFTSPCDPDPALQLSCVGMAFNGSGICTTAGKTGDACGGSGLPGCAVGLYCNATSAFGLGTCRTPPTLGQDCHLSAACQLPAVCDDITFTCAMPGTLAEGALCTRDIQCASNLCRVPENGKTPACLGPLQPPVTCSGVTNNGGGSSMTMTGVGTGAGGSFGGGSAGMGGIAPGTGTGAGTGGASMGPRSDCMVDALPPPGDTLSNFEDGTGTLLPSEGRSGSWSVFDDGAPSCIHKPETNALVSAEGISGGRCTSSFALHLSGDGCFLWGAGLAANFAPATAPDGGPPAPVPYDLSMFTSFGLWARLDTNVGGRVTVTFPDVNTSPTGVICTASDQTKCGDDFGVDLSLSTGWQFFQFPFNALKQMGFGPPQMSLDLRHVFGIRVRQMGIKTLSLWIDDVRFFR